MIKTPPGWGADALTRAYHSVTSTTPDAGARPAGTEAPIEVRRIGMGDLGWALKRGLEDFGSSRTDVIFLCVIYPFLGLLLARLAFGYEMLPLVFPLASGFALVGPLAAVGLNEMSRRREEGLETGWADALGVFHSPSFQSIALLGAVLIGMFLFWLVLAQVIYSLTMGPQPPVSLSGFAYDLLHTQAGRAMVVIGTLTGFAFALVTLAITVVSFPMLLDRNVPLETAIRASVNVVRRNPLTMAAWGAIIAGSLAIGSIPLLLGLVFVMPVLGHATWHLYRRAVPS